MPDPRATAGRDLEHVHEVHPGSLVMTRWMATAINAPAVRMTSWECALRDTPDLPGVVSKVCRGRETEILVRRDGLTASVGVTGGEAAVYVAADSGEAAEAFVAEVLELLPRSVIDEADPRVPVTFWSLSRHGTSSRRRMIAVPRWDDVFDNYGRATLDDLGILMGPVFEPGAGGQLLLWHGPPGTGKTFALRALAWEWREWCSLHYVTDPERLFGEDASYMLDVLLADDDDSVALARPLDAVPGEPDPEPDPRAIDGKWRLLVLEDTGEMMSADARERSGQGLGRLLNVVDGLIGQGLKVLVLVTTNEKITRLHPAVARPGRCAARVYFDAIPEDEAREWLARYDVPVPDDLDGRVTIADLFALRAGHDPAAPEAPAVGFTSS